MRIGVVGGGILGLAVARRLRQVRPGVEVTVLEKEDRVAAHQTGHNSGVAHAGLYYPPDSLKAVLCRRGIGLLKEFCAEHGIGYVECGKVVVARTTAELDGLAEIEKRALANGVPGLRRVDAAGLRDLEPHATGVAALHSSFTAILDYSEVARALALEAGTVRLGFEVAEITPHGSGVRVRSNRDDETLDFDRLVVCAGLQTDRVARLAGDTRGPAIVPFRGEYYRLVDHRSDLVRGLIYPVPDPRYPFLGVHFTRRIGGGVDIGPNAVLALAREGYHRRDVNPKDILATLTWPGFRRMARQHWRAGLREIRGSLSVRAFVAEAATFVPSLTTADVTPAAAGVRAQALDADGTLVDDFRINHVGPVMTLRNAPSPAATSALAIAEHLVDHGWRS
jgi:L-2-hydroxyglutarate oxidase LhgO